jgi:hypothetical protein
MARHRKTWIVDINPFVHRRLATIRGTLQLHFSGSASAKFQVATGESPLAKQTNALIVQTFPPAPGVHPPQQMKTFRHRDVVPFGSLLHTGKIIFLESRVYKGGGETGGRGKP